VTKPGGAGGGAERIASATGPDGFPRGDLPEVAFLGRSNVGKSSLLNRLAGRKRLAFASSKPGTTRLLHFYRLERRGRPVVLVDLPGYGFARVSRDERDAWRALVESYLRERTPLRACVLLQDIRRDLTEDETLLLEWLRQRGLPAIAALTKCDKLSANDRRNRAGLLTAALDLPRDRIVATSAESGLGVPELWKAIEALVAAEGAP
jgi:GTP-binding protein